MQYIGLKKSLSWISERYSPIFKAACREETAWRIISTATSSCCENMLRYFFWPDICSLKLVVFLEINLHRKLLWIFRNRLSPRRNIRAMFTPIKGYHLYIFFILKVSTVKNRTRPIEIFSLYGIFHSCACYFWIIWLFQWSEVFCVGVW